jgi:hypothetical protein
MFIGWGGGVACCKILSRYCKDMHDLPFLLPPNTRGQTGNNAIVKFDQRGVKVVKWSKLGFGEISNVFKILGLM